MNLARTYLNFMLLFDESLIDGKCELLLNGIPVINPTITKESCVELSSNSNYSIQCPLCEQAGRDVYHVIPNNIFTNIEDCFYSGTYVHILYLHIISFVNYVHK